jgi:hypothetical protein
VLLWRLATAAWPEAVPLLLYGLLWTGVIVLSGLAVLRARECYADVQASVWDRASPMDRVLASLATHEGEGWRRYFRFHPDPGERRRVVADPSRLLRPGVAEAFGIGVAAFSIMDVVNGLLFPLMPADIESAQIFYWANTIATPAVVFPLAIGAIGIGVWRHAFASVLKGDHPSRGTGWLGAAFVAGAAPGLSVMVALAALRPSGEASIPFAMALRIVAMNAVIYAVLLLGCLLIFRWIATAASAWFDVVVQSRSPVPILLVSVATAVVLVLGTFGVGAFVIILSYVAAPWRESAAMASYNFGLAAGLPLTVALLTAWAFPLAALWWRRARSRPASWVFLDDRTGALPDRPPLRARGALLTGLAMGLLCWLLWELIFRRGLFPAGIGDAIAAAFGWALALCERVFGNKGFFMPLSAAVFQALAAAIAAARARRLSTMCGLCAASVAGLVIIVGNYVLFAARPGATLAGQVLAALQLVGVGALVALPTALVAGWAGNLARSALARSRPPSPVPPPLPVAPR